MIELLPISVIILIFLIIIGIITVFISLKKRKEVKFEEPNYYALFVMGIIWLPVGLIYMIATVTLSDELPFVIGIPLFSMGLIYLIISSANRDKWIH